MTCSSVWIHYHSSHKRGFYFASTQWHPRQVGCKWMNETDRHLSVLSLVTDIAIYIAIEMVNGLPSLSLHPSLCPSLLNAPFLRTINRPHTLHAPHPFPIPFALSPHSPSPLTPSSSAILPLCLPSVWYWEYRIPAVYLVSGFIVSMILAAMLPVVLEVTTHTLGHMRRNADNRFV